MTSSIPIPISSHSLDGPPHHPNRATPEENCPILSHLSTHSCWKHMLFTIPDDDESRSRASSHDCMSDGPSSPTNLFYPLPPLPERDVWAQNALAGTATVVATSLYNLDSFSKVVPSSSPKRSPQPPHTRRRALSHPNPSRDHFPDVPRANSPNLFPHSPSRTNSAEPAWKRLCRENGVCVRHIQGDCAFGDACHYHHLANFTHEEFNYKTIGCRFGAWCERGVCRYAHHRGELRSREQNVLQALKNQGILPKSYPGVV